MPEDFLVTLQSRFRAQEAWHPDLAWEEVEARLRGNAPYFRALEAMEASGSEPCVLGTEAGRILIADGSTESPAGRRSLCYDHAAWEARKAYRPTGSACGMAADMGVRLMTEAEYFWLQALRPVDLKTSSWLATEPEVRQKGGAIFGDHRFGRTFNYHNGADSYYAARGFRSVLEI